MLEVFTRNYLDVKFDKTGNRRVVVKYHIDDSNYFEEDINLGIFKTVFEALKSLSNISSLEDWKVIAFKRMISQAELVTSFVNSCPKAPYQERHPQRVNRYRRRPQFREKGFMMSPERMIKKYPYLKLVKIHSHLSIIWSNEWKAMVVERFSRPFIGRLYRSLGVFSCFAECIKELPNVMGYACIQDRGCGLEEMIGVFETITAWVEANREWIWSRIR